MSLCLFYVLLIVVRANLIQSSSSRSLPTYDESSFNGGQFSTGGIQLLIPTLNFTCQGAVTEWSAHVTGDTSISDLIEFQIFKPDDVNDDLYHLIYGNPYGGNNVQGSVITRPLVSGTDTFIPIREGYILGIYLPPSVAGVLDLLYDNNGDTDIYYWENIDSRTCNYSLCSGKVKKNVNLLIGWNFAEGVLTQLEILLDNILAGDTSYCQGSISQCINDSIVVTSTTTLSSNPLSSSPISSSFSIDDSTVSIPLSTTTQVMSTTVGPSSTSNESPLAPELIAAFGVVLVLFVIVLVLIIAIGVCCCLRRKPVIESSVAQGFDNPDYNAVVSDKVSPLESVPMSNLYDKTVSLSQTIPKSSPITTQTVVTGSPIPPHFDDAHYYSAAQANIDTQSNPMSPPSQTNNNRNHKFTSSLNTALPPPSILCSGDSLRPGSLEKDNNRFMSPSPIESPTSKSHYYTSPTTDVSNLSFPMNGGIYDTIDENVMPSTAQPDLTPTYDQINIPNKKASTFPTGNRLCDPVQDVYAYVPTAEQRKLLDWRYELPMDSAYNKLTFFEEQTQFWAPATTASDLYEQLATNKYREIPRAMIQIANSLGQGQFGSVNKGIWTSPDGRQDVAIKTLKPDATEEDTLKLLQEAAIMGQFSNKNVVRVQGVVTVGIPILLVLEFMPRGDLRSYLRSIKPKQGRWHPPPNLPKLLLRFCRDIALGMRYLAGKSFVHRDLAARNVLLSSELTCKIGDFGMARDLMQDESNYYTSSGGIIPIKWTAPEALNFRKYSTDSDVWSYGMVLFEIWSLGRKPFSELSNPIVIALINSKHCQAPPSGCPRPIYKLMIDCWNPEHSKRPPFTKISVLLESPSDSLLGWNKEDNIRGKNAHILGASLEDSGDLYVDLQRVYQMSMLKSNNDGRQRSRSHY